MNLKTRFINIKFIGLILLIVSCDLKMNKVDINENQLDKETSLYLKQHSENPINWQRWSNSIFNTSEDLDKLLVVSIGYSSCHWCHVMEEETFANDSIAKIMNENFINVKVDREENPDVDQAYMTASQLMTGMGGWPLNVITLPDGSPIYAGTYHTTEQWDDILKRIIRLKRDNYEGLKEIANNVKKGVTDINTIKKKESISEFNSDYLKKRRRYVIVIIFTVAAILTPPDPITQVGLAIPLLLLYELSIFTVRFTERKKEKENLEDA